MGRHVGRLLTGVGVGHLVVGVILFHAPLVWTDGRRLRSSIVPVTPPS